MIDTSRLRAPFIAAAALLCIIAVNFGAALAATEFNGVAAGDMTAEDAILWTRTVDPATDRPLAIALTAQLAADSEFRNILFTYKAMTDRARDGTIKIEATGLKHTHDISIVLCLMMAP